MGIGFGAVVGLSHPVRNGGASLFRQRSCVFASLFIPDCACAVGGLSVIQQG